ncbi:hypothetical protein [Methanocella conradii]|uniref:hypothetical protein n=1 Tax=Methanocella conradii TaxID=1175444 RepID=UPI0024B37B73|nr:hypothetical protein [Methanocella conradii]MDI6897317.1 hypothetical protein [Methanocella conradii]
MSGIDSLIKDFYTLQSGLVPQNLDKIYIDRQLSENAIITNYYTRYLGNGRFSDLIKSDLDHVFTHQAPQLRPIIGSLGGGKSTLVAAIERIARERYGDHAAIVKINMSDFHTIDPESLTRAVYQEIVIQLKPHLKSMIKEAGDKSYTPYFITPETIANLCSEDRSVAEKAFRSLLGSDKSSKEEIPYIIKGLNEFIVNLFSNTNKILIILYDEVDIFVKLNKDKYPSTIDSFTYTFLRDFTDPRRIDKRPIYVVFTCEREMYEYIKNKCENFYRVAYNNEIIMKQFSDEELFELADRLYQNIIVPIFENKARISQLPKNDIQGIIDGIKARPVLNETIPGYFIKDYLNEFIKRYRLDFEQVKNATKAYEERAFDEFKGYLNKLGGWTGFTRNKVVQGYNFDGYAEVLERGIPVRRAYGEFTTSTASPEKVEKFINWLNNLEKAGQFSQEKGDVAIFISPGISPKAEERAKAYGLKYIRFLNGVPLVEKNKGSSDMLLLIKKSIQKRSEGFSRRKFKHILADVKHDVAGIGEAEVKQAISEMIKEGSLKAKDVSITPDTYISFNFSSSPNFG